MRKDDHYEVEEGKRTIAVTEAGVEFVEDQLGIDNLYEAANTPLVGYLNNALKAKELFKRDRDYIVREGEVLIVDEFTGRVLAGRRYNEGMHQAIEAKEGVQIQQENQTLATVTLQNYFRLYDKLSGMTGTAQTEAAELHQIYKLGVVPIPTNKPMVRADEVDYIYKTEDAKFAAVVDDLAERHEAGQPVLVGTASVAKSELLANLLLRRGIPHEVLNAKQHEREAVDRRYGRSHAVRSRSPPTWPVAVPTSCWAATRSTSPTPSCARSGCRPAETPEEYEKAWPDAIAKAKETVAREHDEVVELGGLYVLGTERHESRRIDNQLRGRSGRQGDPGESRFYLSMGDDLMVRFNGERVAAMMNMLRLPEDTPIENKMVSRSIASAQTQVEGQNFEIRKDVLKYDEVLNKQRTLIYAERRQVLSGADLSDQIRPMITDVVTSYVEGRNCVGVPGGMGSGQPLDRAAHPLPDLAVDRRGDQDGRRGTQRPDPGVPGRGDRRRRAGGLRPARRGARRRRTPVSSNDGCCCRCWTASGVSTCTRWTTCVRASRLRAMAQRDPLVEYQKEGYDMFAAMMDGIREESVGFLFNLEVEIESPEGAQEPALAESDEALDAEAVLASIAAGGDGSHPHIQAKGLDRSEDCRAA